MVSKKATQRFNRLDLLYADPYEERVATVFTRFVNSRIHSTIAFPIYKTEHRAEFATCKHHSSLPNVFLSIIIDT